MNFVRMSGVAIGAVAALTAAAGANPIFSIDFNELSGSYSTGTSTFTAAAVNLGEDLNSYGHVSRDVAPGSLARFDENFVNLPSPADFTMNINVFNRLGNTAAGSGSFQVVDRDGDILRGDISGMNTPGTGLGWTGFGPFLSFQGLLTNVEFVPAAPGNTTFDGTASGGFDFTTFPSEAPYEGALVTLSIVTNIVVPFGQTALDQNFTQSQTRLQAQIIPAPGAAALLGLGGLALRRRRR